MPAAPCYILYYDLDFEDRNKMDNKPILREDEE